jgi:uncharacterized protein (DUF1015 family)
MLNIVPVKTILPRPDIADSVSSENFDAQNKNLSLEEMKRNPYSYLHIAKPHLNFPDEKKNILKHFPFALRKINQFLEEGILQKMPASVFIYRQIKDGRVYQGIIAGAHADDYKENRIRKHENTRTDKELEMMGAMEITHTVGTAVLVAYHQTNELEELVSKEVIHQPHFDFVKSGVRHTVWIAKEGEQICRELSQLRKAYIADGHHRSASLVKYAEKMKAQNPGHTGKEAYNYLQTYFVPDHLVHIFEFNRLVSNIDKSWYKIIKHICDHFTLEKRKKEPYQPRKMHNFGMYFQGEWYKLKAKPDIVHDEDPLLSLDVQILEDYLLKPVLDIKDSKTDERLSFADGTKGIQFLQERVDKKKADIAFTLFPTRMEQVKAVAEINATMPPKSTWIEPKMRTGFIVQDLTD